MVNWIVGRMEGASLSSTGASVGTKLGESAAMGDVVGSDVIGAKVGNAVGSGAS